MAAAGLGQIPAEHVEAIEILLRVDSAGATHELLDWRPATDQDARPRENCQVDELAGLELDAWPVGARVIVRASARIPARSSR